MVRHLSTLIPLPVGLMVFSATTSSGQEAANSPAGFATTPATPAFAGNSSPLLSAERIQRALPQPMYRRNRPSTLMLSLYASTAVMQALDVHSTLSAFRAGATEANPLMQGVTRNRATFMAVKAGVAVSTIFTARQLARRNKVAAIATLIAINTASAMVVHHNYKVARSAKP